MIVTLLVILIILWFLGILPTDLNIPNITFFTINNQAVTLWNLIALGVISWVVGLLPRPFREIAGILLVVWVISLLGILPFPGLSNILLLVIIAGLIFYVLRGMFSSHP